jgi:hypothetical protein
MLPAKMVPNHHSSPVAWHRSLLPSKNSSSTPPASLRLHIHSINSLTDTRKGVAAAFLPPPGRPTAPSLPPCCHPKHPSSSASSSTLGLALYPGQSRKAARPGRARMSTSAMPDAVVNGDEGAWGPIGAPPAELRCDVTLVCGQVGVNTQRMQKSKAHKSQQDNADAHFLAHHQRLICSQRCATRQNFRWRVTGEREWTGVIADTMVTLRYNLFLPPSLRPSVSPYTPNIASTIPRMSRTTAPSWRSICLDAQLP